MAGVFRMEVAAELGVAVDGGGDQLVQDAGVFRAGAEEPGLGRALAAAFERERALQLPVPGGAGAGAARGLGGEGRFAHGRRPGRRAVGGRYMGA